MSMRDAMNKSFGITPDISTLNDNPLELATDEPGSLLYDGKRVFPQPQEEYITLHPIPQREIDEKIANMLEEIFNDEVEAITQYEHGAVAAEEWGRPDIAYILRVLAEEERNHRRIIGDISESILIKLGTLTFR